MTADGGGAGEGRNKGSFRPMLWMPAKFSPRSSEHGIRPATPPAGGTVRVERGSDGFRATRHEPGTMYGPACVVGGTIRQPDLTYSESHTLCSPDLKHDR